MKAQTSYFQASATTTSELTARLSAGESPQVLLREEVAAILGDAPQMGAANRIEFLATKGARVATEEPGCAMESLLYGTRLPRPSLIIFLAERLTDKTGEIPLHLIAKHCPILLCDPKFDQPSFQQGLQSRDSSGQTVLHYLWGAGGAMSRAHDDARELTHCKEAIDGYKRIWSSAINHAWSAQDHLIKKGFNMDTPDKQGRTAMDLCIERIQSGDARLMLDFDVCKQVKACIDQRDMEARTLQPSSPALPRSGHRL